MLEIRQIKDEEFDPCLELIRQSIVELAAEHYSTQQIKAWLNQYPTPEIFATWRNRRTMLIAHEETKLVGFGQVETSRKEIVGVHVSPIMARSGIGSQLVASLEAIGVEEGLTEMVVQSSMNAADFYESCGYKPIRDIEFQLQNKVKLDALFMQKKLATAC